MTQRLDKILRAALWLLFAVTLGSCSQIYDDEGICEQEQGVGNRVNLKFKIYTDYNPSRSRDLGQWEEASANVAERILNPNDVRVLMLNADGQLVKSFKPNKLDYVEGKTEGGITGDGYYELSVYFEDDNLDRLEPNDELIFSVMIFANINSLGGIYTTDGLVYGSNHDKLQELFTMPNNWFPSESKGIPMYGYKSGITVTKKQLEDENYNMGDITMLRALSKIEVYDNVEGTVIGGQKYPYVEKVELTSWRAKGYLRPLYGTFDDKTGQWQLTTAYIPGHPDNYEKINPLITGPDAPHAYAQKMFDGVDINKDDKIDPCYRVYCPEAKLADVEVLVTAKLGPDPTDGSASDVNKTYTVNLGQYADMVDENDNKIFGDALVRNHIYRFSVNSLGASADLTVQVSPWTQSVQEHTLDDIISMDENGYLTWTNTDPDDFSYTEEIYNGSKQWQLSMLRGTDKYVTGTFTIKSPQDAEWRAYFIPGENGVDAFEFVDVDDTGKVTRTSSFATGKVGEQATIHIRGKGPADVYRHYAELVVEVHLPNGTVQYAPLTVSDKTRCIIYRENKL